MDMADLISEKQFLGQEFLTWIWFQSDINSGIIDIPGFGSVEIWFEDRMVLEYGSGNFKQSVTCQGKDLDLTEAKTALREGKKVSQARIRIGVEDREWRLTIKADGLEFSSIKAPTTLDMDEEESESMAGRLLDRVAVIRELITVVDKIYEAYLSVRLTEAWEEKVIPRIREWVLRD